MDRVIVVGGGLAGLAAAVGLAPRGFRVTILEARPRLGGRAGSFTDPATGQLVDACQHVSMGCCTNFTHFCRTVGVEQFLAPQPRLTFVTPDRRRSVFKADPWPAPFHLGRALLGAHYLTPVEKLRVAWGLLALLREKPDADPPLREWLLAHRQTERTIDRFWGVVLVSALNETVDRVGLRYARKVFRDGFVRHRDGFTVHVPSVPLGRFYGPELRGWLDRHGVEVVENSAVRKLVGNAEAPNPPGPPSLRGKGGDELPTLPGDSVASAVSQEAAVIDHPSPPGGGAGGGVATSAPPAATDVSRSPISAVELRDGSRREAEWFVLAAPFDRVPDLLPPALAADPFFAGAKTLTPSPITSVHLWYDRPPLDLPHAVLVDCLGQWVFSRGEVSPGEYYLQVVVSAARPLKGLGRDEIPRRIAEELAHVFPTVRRATLLRAKVVTEHTATFSAIPGVDRFRPPQATPVPNLALAGDWTDTGWPATMEGAVRSGYLAAEAILGRAGRPARLVRPDLGG